MKRHHVALGALIVAGLGGVTWHAMQGAPEVPSVSMAQAIDISAKSELEDLPAAMATTEAGPAHAQQAAAEPAYVPSPLPAARVPLSFEHQQMLDLGKDAEGGDDLHTLFEKEPKDNLAWAYETEAYLRGLYLEAGAEIYSLECRSRTCEVQAFADDNPAVMDVSSKVDMRRLMSMGMSLPINGRQPVLMYYTRYVPSKQTEARKQGQRRRQQVMDELRSR